MYVRACVFVLINIEIWVSLVALDIDFGETIPRFLTRVWTMDSSYIADFCIMCKYIEGSLTITSWEYSYELIECLYICTK